MTDLRVDYQLLDQIDASLGRLAGQFENIQAVQDGYNGAMGSVDITGAMNEFAGNWSIHRQKLTASMQALQMKVRDTRRQFSNTDHDLSQQLASRTR
jgi:hypothetical protein